MRPGSFTNPQTAEFEETKKRAANVPQYGERGEYKEEMLLEDFPQIATGLPRGILQIFLDQANTSVLPSRWGSMWRYAAGLYIAHFAAMYLKTYSADPANASQAAANAQALGAVKSATMGDTSISYDNSAVTAGTEKWGTWNATQYGQQLVTMARMIGMGGMYVI